MSAEAQAVRQLRVGECPFPAQGSVCPACGSVETWGTPHRVPTEDYLRWLRETTADMSREDDRRFVWGVLLGLLALAVVIAWLWRRA